MTKSDFVLYQPVDPRTRQACTPARPAPRGKGARADVAIVGAGLIGSELANDLALGGHRITLLDVQPEPHRVWPAVCR